MRLRLLAADGVGVRRGYRSVILMVSVATVTMFFAQRTAASLIGACATLTCLDCATGLNSVACRGCDAQNQRSGSIDRSKYHVYAF